MPMISTRTNIAVSEAQETQLKALLGKAIEILPGKSENWLMLEFRDKCRLWFRGDDSKPIAFVEVKVFGKIDRSCSEKLTAKICEIFEDVLKIEGSGIYIKYEEISMWGYDGENF